MKRKLLKLFLWTAGFIIILVILNLQVSTRQGINYNVHTIKIPLYLKVLGFFNRHYNYQWTVKRIIGNSTGGKDKVLKIFEWTHKNIRKTPQGYPIIDDHVWHIIVRGYGEDDQSSDVFSTLCNYSGVDAFFTFVNAKNSERRLILSFVNINGRWNMFDPYNGVYFKNNKGELADIKEIVRGNWLIENIDSYNAASINYDNYLLNLQPVINLGLSRANTQSPFNRLKYEIKKLVR